MNLKIEQPATVYVTFNHSIDRFEVLDDSGRVAFFRYLPDDCRAFKFNLPHKGDYVLPEGVKVAVKPLETAKLPVLPAKERDRMTNENLRVVFTNLKGTPARVYTYHRVICITPNFYKLPLPTRLFILLHELGHFYYETEWKCDLFAYYWMLRLGHNHSSAIYGLTTILKHTRGNTARIKKLFNNVTGK